MRVTISLNEAATAQAAQTGKTPDLGSLVRKHSGAAVVRVFGRGRFVSVDTDQNDLHKLKSALGDLCVFALRHDMSPFEEPFEGRTKHA